MRHRIRRWLARKLRSVVVRLAEPIVGRVLDHLDRSAHDTREEVRRSSEVLVGTVAELRARQNEAEQVNGIGLARVEALLDDLAARVDGARREIAEASGRDFGTLVRLSAGIEASVADLHALLRRKGQAEAPEDRTTVPESGQGSRHVLYLGGDLRPEDAAAAAFLKVLRSGLDRLEDAVEGQPEIWIERGQPSTGTGADAVLAPVSYTRILKGGTRSVEVLRAADALAIRQALDANRRRDVRMTFRWVGTAAPEPAQPDLRQALTGADRWIFPNQAIVDALRAGDAVPAAEGSTPQVLIHPLPEPPATDPAALARAYRASVAAVLQSFEAQPAPPP